MRAHVAAKQHGLKLIVGTEIQVEDGPKLLLLATNRESYGHISALITRARTRAVNGSYRVTLRPNDPPSRKPRGIFWCVADCFSGGLPLK